MQVPWLERTNFSRRYSSRSPASVSTWMRLAVTLVTTPGRRAGTTWPESRAARAPQPRAPDGRLGLQERHGLALHVRAHEGTVGVVMLEEGDERGGHRDDLLRADVHELDLGRTRLGELVEVARRHALVGEVTLVIQPGVGLGDVALLFVGGVEVDDLVGDARPDGEGIGLLLLQLGHGLLREALALLEDDRAGPGDEVGVGDLALDLRAVPARAALHLAVGGLDEAVLVDAAVGGERADEADVRALWRLDGADPAVVAVGDVADVEAGALAREAAGAEGREAPLARQLGQRGRLVHELAGLAAAPESLHRGDHGADVDERVGRRLLDLLDRHTLLDHALHAQEADAEGVLDQLAVGADAAVGQGGGVIRLSGGVVGLDEMA